jgi:hypothetical protein
MATRSKDILPLNQVRARFTELAEEVHMLEREHIHLALLEEASRGWEDVVQGRTLSVAQVRAKYIAAKKR